jgi:uncharacterized repeat protein (TIGR02543 family)
MTGRIFIKKGLFYLVLLVLVLSMVLGPTQIALAKTLQQPVADPPQSTVVLNVKIGGVILPYNWGDITGTAGYKFNGKSTSDTYLAVPHDTCQGIKFSDLISQIESTLSITLHDDYQIKAVCSDGYTNAPFTIAEAKNYTANHYLLANHVNGESEACFGYNNTNPSLTYPATYLRIARNRGGDYLTDQFGNTAYLRLISSLQITKSDGTAVELTQLNLSQTNGADLSSLSPAAAGLVIGGSGITRGMGLLGSFVYLNQPQIDFMKTSKSVAGLGLGNSWMTPTLYSSYHNHGIPDYKYMLAEGINLKTALTELGADVTGASVAIEAKGSDGYDLIIDDAFGYNASRNYIAPDGTVGAAVDPLLVFYENSVETSAPDSSVVPPTITTAIPDPNPLFVYGQKYATEPNNCSFIQNTVKIRAGLDTPAFAITRDSMTKSLSLSDIALLGIYQTSYFWENSGIPVTQSVIGVPLSAVLFNMGITIPSDMGLIISVNNGSGIVAGSRTIGYSEINRCFVAFDAFEDGQRVAGSVKPLRIYCPGQTRSNVLIENVVGATVSAAGLYTISFEENGGSPVTDITLSSGSTIDSAPVSTRTGYILEGWYTDENLTVKATFPYIITSNAVLYARWTDSAAYAKGDINNDSIVNIQDVVLAVNFALSRTTPTTTQFAAADYNSDSIINIQDVVLIVNKAMGR